MVQLTPARRIERLVSEHHEHVTYSLTVSPFFSPHSLSLPFPLSPLSTSSLLPQVERAYNFCIIGASLSEPHIDWHNGPRGGECIYLSRGSVCPFQCSRKLGNALFSTCAHYNWRLVSNKLILPGILAMMKMTQGRQQQRSETPAKQQLLHDKAVTRNSPDQRESGRLERQKEYQRAYRRRRRKAVAATEQTVT